MMNGRRSDRAEFAYVRANDSKDAEYTEEALRDTDGPGEESCEYNTFNEISSPGL